MLTGQTVLVVEKEFLIALDIQRMIEQRNASQTVFARSAAEALQQKPSWGPLGLAIVEVREGRGDAIALCHGLQDLDVPLVLMTGDTRLRHGVDQLPDVPVLVKPISEADLASALERVLARRRSQNE